MMNFNTRDLLRHAEVAGFEEVHIQVFVDVGPRGPESSIGRPRSVGPDMEVRRAEPDEWQRVRNLRLRALQAEPDAYGSPVAKEAGADEAVWRSWASGWANAADQGLFVAVHDDAWAGMALGVRWAEDPEVAHLYAMWVEPSVRRRGIGRALVSAVANWAAGLGTAHLVLTVNEDNRGAVTLYERCGFVDTGEREPLREKFRSRDHGDAPPAPALWTLSV